LFDFFCPPPNARAMLAPAGDIDWSAAAWRLEIAVEALERDGLVIDRDLADAALAQCRLYADDGHYQIDLHDDASGPFETRAFANAVAAAADRRERRDRQHQLACSLASYS